MACSKTIGWKAEKKGQMFMNAELFSVQKGSVNTCHGTHSYGLISEDGYHVVLLFVGWFTSQLNAKYFLGQICLDICKCCHTEKVVSDQT